ncbi:MAG: ribosome recycling factor [Bacteroidales bacterium 52_46]|jgi:ribosome recycling factor|nr:MAG: ribosome recycling factor [Bacteroidales bacterium 52_46]
MTNPSTYLDPAEEKMEMSVAYLDEALAHIRAGKANPKILDGIRVDYYGSAAPISNVANVAVPDARTITITPWEKSMFKEIEKAIINSELGITPENNGEVIRISIPPLTEERRKQLVKQSKAEAEQAKVSVRNARRDAIEGLKKAIKQGMPEDVEKDAEGKAQKLHDKYLKKIDELFAAKEKEILTV